MFLSRLIKIAAYAAVTVWALKAARQARAKAPMNDEQSTMTPTHPSESASTVPFPTGESQAANQATAALTS